MTLAATAICSGTGMSTENEFIDSIEGVLTPEQALQLLELGEGDTDLVSDKAAAPEAAPDSVVPNTSENTDAATSTQTVDEDALTADNAVVLARDAKHTIPYERHVEYRDGMRTFKAKAEALETDLSAKDARIAELEALMAQRAQSGEAPNAMDDKLAVAQEAISQGADPSLFGDFSEEGLASGIDKLVSARVAAVVNAELEQRLAPVQQKLQQEETQAHTNAIYQAHPDADSVYESQEFQQWLDSQPSIARNAYLQVLDPETGGSANQVIEVFSAFKQATGATQQAATAKTDAKTQAQQVISRVATPVPNSLSDIPGGRPVATSRTEAMAGMDGTELLGSMENMTAEQIESWLNSL